MKGFYRSLSLLFILVTAMIVLTSNGFANDWKVATGGISQDESSNIGTLTYVGTGYVQPTASASITVGSGQAFFTPSAIVAPKIDISSSTAVIAQVAVGLGSNPTALYYYDPDNFLSPWSYTPVDVYVNGSKNFELFSLEASIITDAIPGDETLEPFGIFVRVLDSGMTTVLDQASFTSFILSPNVSVNPVQAPW
jgi:hypothetical protein